jgi:formamidopyrimidine-DNA glycosylase
MPELPEVETVRRGLVPVLEGRRLLGVTARRRDLRFRLPRDFARRLEGRRVEAVGRRGKFLLLHLDDGWVVLIHLGMSGRIRCFPAAAGPPPPPAAHDHVVFETDAGASLRFNDARRFGFIDLCRAADLPRHPMLSRLGPEPLTDGFDGAGLAARLGGRRTAIKSALGDQSVVAGLGNIYVSESLFRAGLSPKRLADTVKGRRAERLAAAIRAVLEDAIAAGGSTLRDHRRPDGELGYFQHRFAVYGRAGQRCPGCACDVGRTGGIRHIVQAGRSTFYCATRQR